MAGGAPNAAVEQHVETSPNGRYIRYSSVLGKGAYKTVYKAFDTEEALEVAWNKLHVDRLSEHDMEKVSNEVSLLRQVEHKNIIHFYDTWRGIDGSSNQTINFITEQMMSGTLKEYLRKAKAIKLKVIRRWCSNILEAIAYLHSQDPPIMHRDLKCDNIFINGHVGEVKIGDLGLSGVKEREKADSVIGTPEFMAPELYEESYTEKVDIYAFGMCLLEIVSMEYPYSECNNMAQIFKKVFSGEKPHAFGMLVDGAVKDVIAACLQREARRPSAVELLRHPLFSEWEEDDGKASNLSLVKGSSENIPVELSATQSSKNMPIGTELIDWSDPLKRMVLVSMIVPEGSGGDEQQVSVVASKENGGFYIGLEIPIRDAVKRVEFTFDPFEDNSQHIAQEMVSEFDLGPEQLSVIREEIDLQVTLAKEQREAASRNATPQPAPRQLEPEAKVILNSTDSVPASSSLSQQPPVPVPSITQPLRDSVSLQSQQHATLPVQAQISQPIPPPVQEQVQQVMSQPVEQEIRHVNSPLVQTDAPAPLQHRPSSSVSSSVEPVLEQTMQHEVSRPLQPAVEHLPQPIVPSPNDPGTESIVHPPQAPRLPQVSEAPLHQSILLPSPPIADQMFLQTSQQKPDIPMTYSVPSNEDLRDVPVSKTSESNILDASDSAVRSFPESVETQAVPSVDHNGNRISVSDIDLSAANTSHFPDPSVSVPTFSPSVTSDAPQDVPQVQESTPVPSMESSHAIPQVHSSIPHTSSFVSSKGHSTASGGTPSGVLSPILPQEVQVVPSANPVDVREVHSDSLKSAQPHDTSVPEVERPIHVVLPTETAAHDPALDSGMVAVGKAEEVIHRKPQVTQRRPSPGHSMRFIPSQARHFSTSHLQTGADWKRKMLAQAEKSEMQEHGQGVGPHLPQSVSDGQLPPPSATSSITVHDILPRPPSTPITPASSGLCFSDESLFTSSPVMPIAFQGAEGDALNPLQVSADEFSYAGDVRSSGKGESSNGPVQPKPRVKSGSMMEIVVVGSDPEPKEIVHRVTQTEAPSQPVQDYRNIQKHDLPVSSSGHKLAAPDHSNVSSLVGSRTVDRVVHAAPQKGNSPDNAQLRTASWKSQKSEDTSTSTTPRICTESTFNVTSESMLYTICLHFMDLCARGRYDDVLSAISSGASVLFADYDKRTPLHLGASEGHMGICSLLLEKGAAVNAKDRWGRSPLSDARDGGHIDVIELLKKHGAIEDCSSALDVTSFELMKHAALGNLELVREKIVAGGLVTFQDYDKRTPLHLACSEGHCAVAELLLVNGASHSARDRRGSSSVDDAVKNGHKNVLRVLRQYGAAIPRHLFDEQPELARQRGLDLMEHAAKGRSDAVEHCLRLGASPLFSDFDNRTALHMACVEGKLEVVSILLLAGANPNVRDRWGATPIDEARNGGYTAILEKFKNWDLKMAQRQGASVSFDHNAIMNGHDDPRLAVAETDNAHFDQLSHGIATSVSMGAIPNINFSDDFVAEYPSSRERVISNTEPASSSLPPTPAERMDGFSATSNLISEERILRQAYETRRKQLDEEHRKALEGLQRKKSVDSMRSSRGSMEAAAVLPSSVTPTSSLDKAAYAERVRSDIEQNMDLNATGFSTITSDTVPARGNVSHFSVTSQGNRISGSPANSSPVQIIHPTCYQPRDRMYAENIRHPPQVNPTIRLLVDGLIDAAVRTTDNS